MSRIIDTVFPSFNFYIGFLEVGDTLSLMDIAGLFLGGFSECSGLETTMSFETLLEGGVNDRVHRLPGRFEYSNLVLTRGMGFQDDLYNWCESYQKGEGKRRNVFILLANSLRIPLKIWTAERALPVKYSGPSLNAGNSALAIEKVEIAYDKLTLVFSTDDVISGAKDKLSSAASALF